MNTDATGRSRLSTNRLIAMAVAFAVIFVIAISMVASSGEADPTAVAPGEQSLGTSITNASVIVFREGLEAVLIFAAITASFLGARQQYRKPVTLGVAGAFGATVITWFIMTAAVGALPVSEDVLLAITGIVAVIVLLLVMNWFFHKVYWTDHIKELNAKKRSLVDDSESGHSMKFWGFFALGFTAVYREGFEVVLFLQNLNIVAGGRAVFWGVMIGLAATAVVGYLTFVAHHKLPYKRMLVLTGVLLGIVLVVMIGGSVRTLQSLGVISTTPLPFPLPDWWARWFEIVPTYESITIQLLAAAFVMGSYYAAEWWSKEKRRRAKAEAELATIAMPRVAPSAQEVLAATTALPHLAAKSPSVAGSPAAVRTVARAASGTPAPSTICGHDATTLCGCDARTPIAAAQVAAASAAAQVAAMSVEGQVEIAPSELVAANTATEPSRPTTTSPALQPKPIFVEGAVKSRLHGDRPPAFSTRASLFSPDA